MKENPIRDLLAQGNWGEDQALLQGLRQWQYAPVLWQAYETLQEEALFHSQVHGPGHIHRVLLLAALLCWKEGAPEEMVRQVFRAASYHDVGRTFDGYDIYHGARSALRLAALTGQTGEALVSCRRRYRPFPSGPGDGVHCGLVPAAGPAPRHGADPSSEGCGQPGPSASGRLGPKVSPA